MDLVKVARAIGVLNRTFQSYISKALSDKDLSYSDSIFLVNIGNRSGISQEELSDLLAIDKSAIARSVKTLEEKGYIQSERSGLDKRAKELYLTDLGKGFAQFMDGLQRAWADNVMKDMSQKDLAIFADWIDLMSSRAKDYISEGQAPETR